MLQQRGKNGNEQVNVGRVGMRTSFPDGLLGLRVVCCQVGNGMQGSRGDGVVRALPQQPCKPLHCIMTHHLCLSQALTLEKLKLAWSWMQ